MGQAAGIDLGTTFSAIAIIGENGKPEIIKNAEGDTVTPSVIYLGEASLVIGKEAKRYQTQGDEHVVSFFKRVMGDPNWIFSAGDKNYTPVDLSSFILKKLKKDAEDYLGKEITHSVITVPAYFSDLQRRNTIEAGKQAGLIVLRIINEPTAAAISYGAKYFENDSVLLVYDLGGGTFDVTLVKIDQENIEVIATDGNHELGGKDWDDAILRYASTQFREEYGLDPLSDIISLNDLMVRAEEVKKILSVSSQATIVISYGGKTGHYTLTRSHFEMLTSNLLEQTMNLTKHVLAEAHYDWNQLDGILLVGGSTKMPMIHQYVTEKSQKSPLKGINVDEAVALGAAIQADFDMKTRYGLPQTKEPKKSYSLAPQRIIKDVMSHSLGMVAINTDHSGYINSIIIPKNHPIPSCETRPYQFKTSGQKANEMEVYITQGESERPLDCSILGKYRFFNIPHNPETGKAIIDISYEYDHNGVVQISAKERSTGQILENRIEPVPEDLSWMDEAPKDTIMQEHVSLFVIIDISGSMNGEPIIKAKEAAKSLISKMDITHTSIGLIVFAEKVDIIQNLCQDGKKIAHAIESITIGQVGINTSAQPFHEAKKHMQQCDGPRFLLVLTDGIWSDQQTAIREANECHKSGIDVIAIGFGSADSNFLKQIASSDNAALFTDLNHLVSSFDKVAQVLTEWSNGIHMEDTVKKNLLSFFNT